MDIKNIEEKFLILVKDLNNNDISWALGGSYLLYLEGYPTDVNDIDIIIDEKDYDKLNRILVNYTYSIIKNSGMYGTKHFYTLNIDDVDFDLMIGFTIFKDNETYVFPFKVEKIINIKDTRIYLASINEWLKAYEVMGREQKVTLIKNGIKKV